MAYVVGEMVYGWRGHYLGWFVDGIFFDNRGFRVGCVREQCRVPVKSAPPKAPRNAMDCKGAQEIPHNRPAEFRGAVSEMTLDEFLAQDTL